jgi:hypothetical protein
MQTFCGRSVVSSTYFAKCTHLLGLFSDFARSREILELSFQDVTGPSLRFIRELSPCWPSSTPFRSRRRVVVLDGNCFRTRGGGCRVRDSNAYGRAGGGTLLRRATALRLRGVAVWFRRRSEKTFIKLATCSRACKLSFRSTPSQRTIVDHHVDAVLTWRCRRPLNTVKTCLLAFAFLYSSTTVNTSIAKITSSGHRRGTNGRICD